MVTQLTEMKTVLSAADVSNSVFGPNTNTVRPEEFYLLMTYIAYKTGTDRPGKVTKLCYLLMIAPIALYFLT